MKRKTVGPLVCAVAALFLLAGCNNGGGSGSAGSSSPDSSGQTGVPNPVVAYDNVEAAAEAMGVEVKIPAVLPEGYAEDSVDVIGGTLLQVIYKNGAGEEITYRTAEGSEDISGDYSKYDEETGMTVGEPPETVDVTAKGAGGGYSLALWQDSGMSYSLSFGEPVAEDVVAEMVESVK